MGDYRNDTKAYRNVQRLIDDREEVDDKINDDYLSNVFHYKTEQDLYDYGSRHRGIDERIQSARNLLNQLDIIIGQQQLERNNRYQSRVQTGLAFLGVFQLYAFLQPLLKWIIGVKESDEIKNADIVENWTWIINFSIIGIIAIVLLISNNNTKSKKRRRNSSTSDR